MAAEWELVEESWKNERSKLEMQIDENEVVLSHIEEIEKWLQQARMQLNDGQNINSLLQQSLVSSNFQNWLSSCSASFSYQIH